MKEIIAGVLLVLVASIGWNIKQAFDINALERQRMMENLKYAEDLARLRNESLAQERGWAQERLKAEIEANEKIQAANDGAIAAVNASNRVSKELSEANKRLSSAPRETVINYAITGGELLESCIGKYIHVAGKADGHAIDARRLDSAWPKESPN